MARPRADTGYEREVLPVEDDDEQQQSPPNKSVKKRKVVRFDEAGLEEQQKQRKSEKADQAEGLAISRRSAKEDILARTMFDMVCPVALQGVESPYKVLFATQRQSQIIGGNVDALQKLASDFCEQTPKVVINLLTSPCPSYGRLQDKGLRELEQIQHRLDVFMRHVLLPIAEESSALVLCDAVAGNCMLADSFIRAEKLRHGAWSKKKPFTLLGFTTMRDLNQVSEKAHWRLLMEGCEHWTKAFGKYTKKYDMDMRICSVSTAKDIQPAISSVIIVGGLETDSPVRGAAAASLKTALVSYLGSHLPSIAVKTGVSEHSSLQQEAESGLQVAVDALQNQTPVVFLDLIRVISPQQTVDSTDDKSLHVQHTPHDTTSATQRATQHQTAGTPADEQAHADEMGNKAEDLHAIGSTDNNESNHTQATTYTAQRELGHQSTRNRLSELIAVTPAVKEAPADERDYALENQLMAGVRKVHPGNLFDTCAISHIRWRYQRFFQQQLQQSQHAGRALWEAIEREQERSRKRRDELGAARGLTVLHRVFEKQAQKLKLEMPKQKAKRSAMVWRKRKPKASAPAPKASQHQPLQTAQDGRSDEVPEQGKANVQEQENDKTIKYAFVTRAVELVLSEKLVPINIWEADERLTADIYGALTRDRLPRQHNLEALCLLRDACTEHDAAFSGNLLWQIEQALVLMPIIVRSCYDNIQRYRTNFGIGGALDLNYEYAPFHALHLSNRVACLCQPHSAMAQITLCGC